MIANPQARGLTPDEYLAWEREQPIKHEYIDGEVYAMAGGTLAHNAITVNVVLPSVIDTPKNRQDMGHENAWQWVTPESLAGVIVFLASPAAKDIRGAAIPVYGKA